MGKEVCWCWLPESNCFASTHVVMNTRPHCVSESCHGLDAILFIWISGAFFRNQNGSICKSALKSARDSPYTFSATPSSGRPTSVFSTQQSVRRHPEPLWWTLEAKGYPPRKLDQRQIQNTLECKWKQVKIHAFLRDCVKMWVCDTVWQQLMTVELCSNGHKDLTFGPWSVLTFLAESV